LRFTGRLAALNDVCRWKHFLSALYAIDWVVHSKPPAAGPEVVLKYLARYTHRVAISDDRIVRIAGGRITFRYKNYARRGRWQQMTLPAEEFLRRFLQHVLPKGFVRIRAFGILANRGRNGKLARCRQLLAAEPPEDSSIGQDSGGKDIDSLRCPHCGHGSLQPIAESSRPSVAELVAATYGDKWFDTS